MNAPTSILLRAPNWVGDCVMSLPTIQALHAHFPEATIDVAARSAFADCYLEHAAVNVVIACPARGRGLGALAQVWGGGRALSDKHYDLGILLTNSFSTALWLWRTGAKKRLGFAKDARGIFLTDSVSISDEIAAAHQTDYYLHLSGLLGASTARTHPELIVPAAGKEAAAKLCRSREIEVDNYAVVAPVSGYGAVKDWAGERYAEVAARLHNECGLMVLIAGTPAQREACQVITEQATKRAGGAGIINLAGETNVGGFFALVGGAKVFLGGDSGGAHVAAALRVPTVAIFGITEPSRTHPLGEKVRTVGAGGERTPRLSDPVIQEKARAALAAISSEEVWQAVRGYC